MLVCTSYGLYFLAYFSIYTDSKIAACAFPFTYIGVNEFTFCSKYGMIESTESRY